MQTVQRTFKFLVKTTLRVERSLVSAASKSSTHDHPNQVNIPNKEELTQEEMDKIQNNPYFNKYANKLKNLQDSQPEQFQEKIDKLVDQRVEGEIEGRKAAEEMRLKMNEASSQTKPKTLDSVMKTELLVDKTSDEISEIWKQHHQSKKFVFACIPSNEYEIINQKLREFPCFIYPIPRGTGYEFYLQQFANNQINFTPLSMFQIKKEESPNCLSLIHYPELSKSKGLILMHGEPDTTLVSIPESQLLAMQVKMYYGIQSGLKFNLVRQFNLAPDQFRHMDLVKEFENYKKDITIAKNLEF